MEISCFAKNLTFTVNRSDDSPLFTDVVFAVAVVRRLRYCSLWKPPEATQVGANTSSFLAEAEKGLNILNFGEILVWKCS